jgi:membrane-bound inhibitor of C-type lysozyme
MKSSTEQVFLSDVFIALLSLAVIVTMACLVGCGGIDTGDLKVRGGESIIYQCENGKQIVARYYSLADGSLDFVKITVPEGKEYTLPRVLSASGVRYTDDLKIVWWTKGESAFLEARGENGKWQVKYQNCKQVTTTDPLPGRSAIVQ